MDFKSRLENQIHDFSPPIPPSGLFWTTPVPPQSASIDVKQGTAAFRLSNVSLPDWGTLRYATTGGPHTPSVVSFDVRWSDPVARVGRSHAAQRWEGEYVQTTATIEWSARQEGFTFKSDPRQTSKSQSAVIGRHRNGVFFSG